MENNEIENTWRMIDSELNLKSKEELNQLLISKTRKTINKFLYVIGFSIFACAGLITFLIIASFHREADTLYLVNNLTLCLITIIALVSSLTEWYKMQNNRYNQTLKSWLEERIHALSKELTGKFRKLYLYLIPIVYILTILSIHVYFENKPFLEVFQSEESLIGLAVGTPVGLFVSYFAARKIRKFKLKNLEYLEELHGLL